MLALWIWSDWHTKRQQRRQLWPKPGENVRWVCTEAGTPGEWAPFGHVVDEAECRRWAAETRDAVVRGEATGLSGEELRADLARRRIGHRPFDWAEHGL